MDKVQRLALINQYRILEIIDPTSALYHARDRIALENGYEYQIEQLVNQNTEGWLSKDDCLFVIYVLAMYERIEDSIRALNSTDQATAKALPWMDFTGFDGNNEGEYMGYVHFLIEKEGKWTYTDFAKRKSWNAHMPTVGKYRGMVALAETIPGSRYLSLNELQQLSAV